MPNTKITFAIFPSNVYFSAFYRNSELNTCKILITCQKAGMLTSALYLLNLVNSSNIEFDLAGLELFY